MLPVHDFTLDLSNTNDMNFRLEEMDPHMISLIYNYLLIHI